MYTYNHICIYKYIYNIHNYNFSFENKVLDKRRLLLSFEFLGNCYFLALSFTGRKTRQPSPPRHGVPFDVPTI